MIIIRHLLAACKCPAEQPRAIRLGEYSDVELTDRREGAAQQVFRCHQTQLVAVPFRPGLPLARAAALGRGLPTAPAAANSGPDHVADVHPAPLERSFMADACGRPFGLGPLASLLVGVFRAGASISKSGLSRSARRCEQPPNLAFRSRCGEFPRLAGRQQGGRFNVSNRNSTCRCDAIDLPAAERAISATGSLRSVRGSDDALTPRRRRSDRPRLRR